MTYSSKEGSPAPDGQKGFSMLCKALVAFLGLRAVLSRPDFLRLAAWLERYFSPPALASRFDSLGALAFFAFFFSALGVGAIRPTISSSASSAPSP